MAVAIGAPNCGRQFDDLRSLAHSSLRLSAPKSCQDCSHFAEMTAASHRTRKKERATHARSLFSSGFARSPARSPLAQGPVTFTTARVSLPLPFGDEQVTFTVLFRPFFTGGTFIRAQLMLPSLDDTDIM